MEKLLSINDASSLTGLTVNTLYVFISQKRIPYVKLGKRVFFKPSELERWVDEHARKEIKKVAP
jgi:excisionase family DNA binding protein